MFYVGQKVVCVNAMACARWLVEGATYTIAEVEEMPMGVEALGTSIGVNLVGVGHVLSGAFQLQTFAATRFRPLTDTSMSDVLARKAPTDSRQWDNRRKVKEKVS